MSVESLKKLIYLAVNDSSNFKGHAQHIAQMVKGKLTAITDDSVKLLVLQLLSEIASNYTQLIPA